MPALTVALALDAASIALLAANVVIVNREREPDPRETFFSDPLPAVLVLAAGSLAILAGAVALGSLVRAPLQSRAGRWATRLAVVNALLLPVVGLSVTAVAWLAGFDLPDGWGEPLTPVWMLTGVAAGALGVVAREPGRRGILVVPFMIGAFVLVFWVGEVAVPH